MPTRDSTPDRLTRGADGVGAHAAPPAAPAAPAAPATTPVESPTMAQSCPQLPALVIPERMFGPYQILAELATGGMGVVYHVRDTRLGREVALKKIRSGVLASPEEIERFQREARAVAQMKHRHIVALYDVGAIDGQHYFTMELARGGSLADHRARYQADRRAAVVLLAKAARAMAYVHAQGRVHRDLKPANILLQDGDEPLISDFGLTKAVEPGADPELTRTGAPVGTPAYMAPEQAVGALDVIGPSTDVWSLGVIAYELLCGGRPFVDNAARRLKEAIIHDPPCAPRRARPDLDRDLETMLLKCLEKDPAHRYASAAEVADDLEAWLAGEPIRARPVGRLRRVHRWGRRHARALAAAVLGLAVAIALAVARPWEDPDRPLRRIEEALDAKQAVTLLRQTGGPDWSRAITPVKLHAGGGNEEFQIVAKEWGLVLLVPDARVTRYRLQGEVRLDSRPGGYAGLFCCRSRHDTEDGSLDALAAARLWFWQQSPVAALDLVHFAPQHPREKWRTAPAGGLRRLNRSPTDWYLLVVDASPQLIRMMVDDQEVCGLSDAARIKAAGDLTGGRQDVLGAAHPMFFPRGGIGIFVARGAASFRNLVLTPTP